MKNEVLDVVRYLMLKVLKFRVLYSFKILEVLVFVILYERKDAGHFFKLFFND